MTNFLLNSRFWLPVYLSVLLHSKLSEHGDHLVIYTYLKGIFTTRALGDIQAFSTSDDKVKFDRGKFVSDGD